jgi:Uma2 family endonuclease
MTLINDVQPGQRITLEQYKALPEGPPKYEFELGVLVPMTQPTPEHQDVFIDLCHLLRWHVRRNKLGRVFAEPDVFLPDGRGYIPDIVFLSNERMGLYDTDDKCIHGAPDLCVEVISGRPSRDRVDKFSVYFKNQVPWYWLVDPATLDLEEYQAIEGGYLRTASILGGDDFKPALFPSLVINLKRLLEEGTPT